ncbi:MAG TPA: M3 family metallopeptidase [Candidatus Sabulitectum sp.]|nr:M3 family metallopeptidase [Candidatus Sabulitectum sp.]
MSLEVVQGHLYDYPTYYDLVFASDWKAEFDFLQACFQKFAKRPVKRVFEPACGTGRLLYKLANAGYEVAGNDLNPKAVAFCNARLKRYGHAESAVVGDMSDFTVKKKFDAAFNMINSFRHLKTEKEAVGHLQCVAEAMNKGGVFILGMHLNPEDVGEDYEAEEEWSARRGNLQVNTRLWSMSYDPKTRTEQIGFQYDVYTPTVPGVDKKYTADEAKKMTLDAVKLLGDGYVEDLAGGFRSRWVDLYENTGKRSGAYSGGCYDSPPYMLLNYSGTLDSVFTMAHEAGHSMHSWYSRKNQPYHTSDYKILVAEVASITNEMLLASTQLRRTTDESVAAYLVDSQVNDFRTTLFRQTMFAEFELMVHQRVESGEPISAEWLSSAYYDLVKLYHGDAFEYDSEDSPIAYEWARIPHFYYNFYVYKYATGMASAASISERIISGDARAVPAYLGFLSSGGSLPPLELLKAIGVDLETPKPVEDAMEMLEGLVNRLEKMLGIG